MSSRKTAVTSEYALSLRQVFSLVFDRVGSSVMSLETVVDVGSFILLERWVGVFESSSECCSILVH